MKKYILIMFGIIVLFSIINVEALCYQETANASTAGDGSCGLNYTGNYLYTNDTEVSTTYGWNYSFDGNWLTPTIFSHSGNHDLYINYTKPTQNQTIVIWQTRVKTIDWFDDNFSVSLDCLNYSIDTLSLRLELNLTNKSSMYYCYNGSWELIGYNDLLTTGTTYIHEEGIYWNVMKNITINITNIDGVQLYPECNVNYGSINEDYIYTFINNGNDTLTCHLDGYIDLSETLSILEGDKDFTMDSEYIDLMFYYYNNSNATIKGFWTDGIVIENISGNNIKINMTDVNEDYFKVFFGLNKTFVNETQFYEAKKEWIVNTTENITMMTDTNLVPVHIKVLDDNGNVITGALIKMDVANPASGSTYQFIGQRFTGNAGMGDITFFYVPPNQMVSIRVSADGYETVQMFRPILTPILDATSSPYTSTTPLQITLTRNITNVFNGIMIRFCDSYDNTTATIPMSIYAPSRNTIQFNTSQNSILYSISLDRYKNGRYTLRQGIHYSSSSTDNLVIYVYADGEYFNNYTIPYKTLDTSKFNEPNGLDEDTIYKLAWLGLIVVIAIGGLMFKTDDESVGKGRLGKVFFMIGGSLLGLLFYGRFMYLTIIIGLYGGMLWLKKQISE